MRIIPLLLVLLLLANTDASAAERLGRDVTTAGLAGSFVRPDGSGPAKAVLMIAGSGPTDRNGNSRLGVDANYLEMLAGHLAGANIAALRQARRGWQQSPGYLRGHASIL